MPHSLDYVPFSMVMCDDDDNDDAVVPNLWEEKEVAPYPLACGICV